MTDSALQDRRTRCCCARERANSATGRRLRSVFPLAVAICATLYGAQGFAQGSPEYAIKAAYLYNFGRYVEWPQKSPPDSQSPFVIAVLGADPFGELLDEVAATKRVEGRQIVVRRHAAAAQVGTCHVLFLSASTSPEEKTAALRLAEHSGILLVGEEPGFAERGGMINFVIAGDKVRLEVNPDAARRGDLKISSKLLSLAKVVSGN